MSDARILHLTINRETFAEIASGRKTVEYRECGRYWDTRIWDEQAWRPRGFDEVHVQNGRGKDGPFMRLVFGGIVRWPALQPSVGEPYYAIHLGRILETRNWTPEKGE